MGRKKTGPEWREIVSPDEHCPYHHPAAVSCFEQAIQIVKPDGYTCLGDIMENEGASSWQWKKKKRPPLDYQLAEIDKDIEQVNWHLDKRDKALKGVKRKRFIQGNHDEWLDRLVEEYPHLTTTKHKYGSGYHFRDAMSLDKRGYEFSPLGEFVKYGKLYMYHGHHYAGKYHTENHLNSLGCNIMYGHWHDVQMKEKTHIDGAKAAWSIGCLKRFDHDAGNAWLGRRRTNWGHAFAIVDFFSNGMFTVDVVRIIDGKCTVWGNLIDGD